MSINKNIFSEFYNPENKSSFISRVDKKSQISYTDVFKKTAIFERKYSKDIMNFNIHELVEIFQYVKAQTYPGISRYKSVINTYIWIMKPDIRNPLDSVTKEWLKQFIIPLDYLTEEDINNIISVCVNAQDAVIIRLIFDGVKGQEESELLNLKESDVNFENNELKLIDDLKGERTVVVSDKSIDLIKKALKETIYHNKNGVAEKRNPVLPLIKNDYVIRSAGKRAINTERSDKHTIFRRLTTISEFIKNPNFGGNLIKKSGMISLAKDIYLSKGKLETEEMGQVVKQFNNINKVKMHNGKYYYNFTNMKEYINSEVLERMYGVKINEMIEPFKVIDENEVDKTTSEVKKRENQIKFKDEILENYKYCCAISKDTTIEILEAAHIQRYLNNKSNHPQNGVLLRVDFHRLFDSNLIIIDEEYYIHINENLSEYYQGFNGIKLNLPENINYYPSLEALKCRIKI